MALQKAVSNPSSASEIDARTLSSHRLHPDLEAFIARGGLTALLDVHSSRECRLDNPSSKVEKKLTKRVFCQDNALKAVGNGQGA